MKGIFNQAMTAIPKQRMDLQLFESYTTTPDGLQVAQYATVTTVYGSAQSLSLQDLDMYGFKSKLDALMFYLPQKVFVSTNNPPEQSTAPDVVIGASKLTYNGTVYILRSDYLDWLAYAGYVGALGVREGVQ